MKETTEAQKEMEKEQSLEKTSTSPLTEPDFVRIEKNIAAFGFFTPSSKRIKNVPKIIKFSHVIDGNRVEAEVKISGNVEYGMPITGDQDKYIAFQKIIERVKKGNGTVANPITFHTSELLALLDISKNGNRYREVEEWLDVMSSTYIKSKGAVWLNGKKRYASDSFVIFQRVRRVGQELDDGSVAEKNYVWLSDWYLENLNAHYLLPIDFENYKLLKNHVAKALIPLLQVWLYASRETGQFEKRYGEICQTLNVKNYQYLSDIKRFFGKSLNELIEFGYLDGWAVEKTSDKKDFKIVFKHGWKFYSDRRKAKHLVNRKLKIAKNSSPEPSKGANQVEIPGSEKKAVEGQNFASEAISAAQPEPVLTESLPATMTEAHREVLGRLHLEYQISFDKAMELVGSSFEETVRQLDAFRFREVKPNNRAGFLIEAIEKAYSLPEAYHEYLRAADERKVQEQRKAKIEACPLCNESGWRNVKNEMDTFYGVMHQCTHDPAIESTLEEHTV
ncbi:MAG: replication initiator protein A [Acidobacteriota bacterium]|nr:replication initiator protein A [Acidobacteriota bacterium]